MKRSVPKAANPVHAAQHKDSAFFQPKLTINTPGDKYEQEADAVADQVMRMPQNSHQVDVISPMHIQRKCKACEEEELQRKEKEESRHTTATDIQRKCAACEEEGNKVQRKSENELDGAPESLSQQLSTRPGSGNPLDATTLASMNHSFGSDFSGVRVHTDVNAAQMNKGIQAKAFTYGSDIYFNDGHYNPRSTEGKRLLAHELTHVEQQNGSQQNIQRKLKAEPSFPQYLISRIPGNNPARDPASKLSSAQRIAHVASTLSKLCPDFQVDGSTGIVSPRDPNRNATQISAGTKPTACCCLHILTRPASTNNWRILVSDVVSPHTLESEHVVVMPGPGAPISYGHWTAAPGEQRVLMSNETLVGHELCGHAGLMELSAHPADTGRLTSAEHDPTVNIQNVIAREQGVPQSDLRGLAAGGSHRGESFARIIISGYPINRISPFSIPDRTQQEKLFLATRLVQANDFFVDIIGHTDRSGGDNINDKVSLDRAEVVKAFIAARVTPTRHLDRFDNKTPIANRFRSTTGVRDSQPPDPALQGNPDNWRRVEIFLASFPAGTNNPPSNTPTTVDPAQIPSQAGTLASKGDDCEKKLVNTAYPPAAPVVAPKRMDNAHVQCNTCVPQITRSSEETEPIVQRKIMHLETIKDRLTRGGWDLAITDENVHDVLVLLNRLNDVDFGDTVRAMDSRGYVSTLFDQVGDKDKETFAVLLRRIHLNRMRKVKDGTFVTDSCSEKNRKKLDTTSMDMADWAERCLKIMRKYVFDMEITDTPDQLTVDALEWSFFHQKAYGELPAYRKIKYANRIVENFRRVSEQPTKFRDVCTQPYDPMCSTFGGYVSSSDNTVNYCPGILNKSREERISLMFHEYVHVHASVGDTGYGHERIYLYIPPEDAINNADSYTQFAIQVLKPKGVQVSASRRDYIEDSNPKDKETMQKSLAFAARLVLNALNVLSDAENAAGQKGGANERFFKTRDRAELRRVLDRFRNVGSAFRSSIEVEFESSCDKGEAGYNRHPGSVVHICPAFLFEREDDQTNLMLVLVMERKGGGDIGSKPGTSAFQKQDKDDAYKNLWTYVAYARDVSGPGTSWEFVNAEFRYEREIQNQFIDLSSQILLQITDELDIRKDIRDKHVEHLRIIMLGDLGRKTVNNPSLAAKTSKEHISNLRDLMTVGRIVSDGFLAFSSEALMKRFLVDEQHANAAKEITDRLEKMLRDEIMHEVESQMRRIVAGLPMNVPFAQRFVNVRVQHFINNLKLVDAYVPFAKEAMSVGNRLYLHMEKLKGLLPEPKRKAFEEVYFFRITALEGMEEWGMLSGAAENIAAGKAFDKKNKPGDP
ncbi:MAG TPA: DUF4157 domain-containing protein, partial [Saprospiraceae bacterium]|nr:DUF4157 domain-containing protein [Saprospiraceae bacterium]